MTFNNTCCAQKWTQRCLLFWFLLRSLTVLICGNVSIMLLQTPVNSLHRQSTQQYPSKSHKRLTFNCNNLCFSISQWPSLILILEHVMYILKENVECQKFSNTTIKSLRTPKSNFRASALTWFIRYIHYCMLQFLHNVIVDKTKVLRSQAEMNRVEFGNPFQAGWFYCSQNFKLFGFPIFRFWTYLMKGIPETGRYAPSLISTFYGNTCQIKSQ